VFRRMWVVVVKVMAKGRRKTMEQLEWRAGGRGDSTGNKQGMCSAVSTEYLWLGATRPGMLVGKAVRGRGRM